MGSGGDVGGGLSIQLMGELTVMRGGLAQPLPASKKSRALLAYLVASGRAQRREQLCSLLWEGPDDPRAGVRWALSKIRPVLDEPGVLRVVGDREHVGFQPQGAEVDLTRLRAVTAAGVAGCDAATLTGAVGSFRGNFLEGLDLPSCPRFHAWCLAERESLRTLEVAVRSALLAHHRQAPQEALPHARALLALDPLAESSHIAVVRLLGELGRTHEALDAYEHCRTLLERELGTRPSLEMERERMRLGRGEPVPVRPREVTADPVTPGEPPLPLFGREREQQELRRHLEAATGAQAGQILLLLGDAGVGKTRLLAELGDQARARGGALLSGKAFEAELVRPYGVWIEALGRAQVVLDGLPPAIRTDLAPLFPQPDWVPEATDRARLFAAVKQAVLAQIRPGHPLVLALDDVQWLDEASAALLHYLLRALEGAPVLFVCAAREGELGDNPAALRLIRTLDRDRRLTRLRLRPLDAQASAALVRTVARDADTDRVFTEAEGNPLYTIEVARALRGGQHEPRTTLEALIAERVDRLDPAAFNLLPWAAALGRTFDPKILAAVTGLPLPQLCVTLEELERREIFRGAGPAGYDFTHDLFRRAIYHRMPDARRRLVHLQIARSLLPLAEGDSALAGDLAHHAALGGDSDTAARAYLAAGERCLRMTAWGEARELARRGLREVEALSGHQQLRLRLGLIGVEVLAHPSARRYPQVERELSEVIEACEQAGLVQELGRGYYLRSVIGFHREDWNSAYDAIIRSAEVRSRADTATRAQAVAETARCLIMIEKEIPRARDLIAEARALLAGAPPVFSLQWATALLARYAGDADQAEQGLRRTLVLAREEGLRWEEQECLRQLTMLELERARPQAAVGRSAELCLVAAKMTDDSDTIVAEGLAALAGLEAAGPAGDLAAFDRQLVRLREADVKVVLSFAQNLAAGWELRFGDTGRAGTRAAEALAAARAIDRKSQVVAAVAVLARVALRQGGADAARRQLAELETSLAEPLQVSAFAHQQVDRARAEMKETQPWPT
jgi:DNA-binding SARP family transcriptional activator